MDSIASPRPYHYRHRVRLQVKDKNLHFFYPHSSKLLQIKECPILVDGFYEQLSQRALEMPDTRDWNQSAISEVVVEGHRLKFDDRCFTQAHVEMNQLMWARIKEDVELIESRRKALDLYCGIGNFSVPLKDYFEDVTGVESEGASIDWAKKNGPDIQWHTGLCEDWVRQLTKKKEFFDFVLLDPPRTGALKVCQTLSELRPPRITYVSCSLESLIVDLTFLLKKGGYRVTRWTVVDLFPQTHHIESIVSLMPQ